MLFTRGKKFFFTLFAYFAGEGTPASPNNFAFFKLNAHLNLSQTSVYSVFKKMCFSTLDTLLPFSVSEVT